MPGEAILELDRGLGLVGIVAAQKGAKVLLTDYKEDSIVIRRQRLNEQGCAFYDKQSM